MQTEYTVLVRPRAENLRRFVAALALAFACFGLPLCDLRAEPAEERFQVVGASECPSPQAVSASILQLTSPARRRALAAMSRVIVTDEGEHYRVDVTGEATLAARTYTDPSRDCERRARFAAVFAVLTLMPPELDDAELETRAEPQPRVFVPEAPQPSAPARLRPGFRLELAAVIDRGAPVIQDAPSFGGELRALLGRGSVAGLVTLGYFPRAELAHESFRYGVERVPASLGARASFWLGGFDVGIDAGVAAVLIQTEGLNLVRPAEDTAALLGFRAGVGAALPIFRGAGPVLGATAFVWPIPSELEASPRGSVARLPPLWVGLSLGVTLGL